MKQKLGKLGDALRERLKAKRFTLARAAEGIGVNRNSLRSWVSKNRFPEADLLLIAEFAGLPADMNVLSREFEFQITNSTGRTTHRQARLAQMRGPLVAPGYMDVEGRLLEALDAMDMKAAALARVHENFTREVQNLFASMGKDDVFVYLAATELPYEWGEPSLTADIANAIAHGSHFVYVCLDGKIVSSLKRSGLSNVVDEETFDENFKLFRQALLLTGVSEEQFSGSVHKILNASCPAFLAPKHKYVLFIPARQISQRKALALFPVGARGTPYDLHVPLVDTVAQHFYQVIWSVAQDQEDKTVAKLLLGPTRAHS